MAKGGKKKTSRVDTDSSSKKDAAEAVQYALECLDNKLSIAEQGLRDQKVAILSLANARLESTGRANQVSMTTVKKMTKAFLEQWTSRGKEKASTECNGSVSSLHDVLAGKDRDIASLKEELANSTAEHREDVGVLEDSVASITEEKEDLRAQLDAMKREYERLGAECSAEAGRIVAEAETSRKREIADLKENISSLQGNVKSHVKTIEGLQNKLIFQQETINSLQIQATAGNNENIRLEKELMWQEIGHEAAAEVALGRLEDKIVSLRIENTKLKAQVDTKSAEADQCVEIVNRFVEIEADLKGAVTALQTEKSRLERELTVQQGELSGNISKLEETVASLEDEVRNQEIRYSNFRTSYASCVSGEPMKVLANLTMQTKHVVKGVQPGEVGRLTYEPGSERINLVQETIAGSIPPGQNNYIRSLLTSPNNRDYRLRYEFLNKMPGNGSKCWRIRVTVECYRWHTSTEDLRRLVTVNTEQGFQRLRLQS